MRGFFLFFSFFLNPTFQSQFFGFDVVEVRLRGLVFVVAKNPN